MRVLCPLQHLLLKHRYPWAPNFNMHTGNPLPAYEKNCGLAPALVARPPPRPSLFPRFQAQGREILRPGRETTSARGRRRPFTTRTDSSPDSVTEQISGRTRRWRLRRSSSTGMKTSPMAVNRTTPVKVFITHYFYYLYRSILFLNLRCT